MMERIRRVLARVGVWADDLLYPQDVACLCCDGALGEKDTDGVCASCQAALQRLAQRQEEREADGLEPLPEGLDALHAAFVYEGPARKLVHRLKYESVRAAAVPLARQMAYLSAGEEEMIVPVPTDAKRERKRGFNQSEVLAQYMADELGMRMERALIRVDARRPQTGLTAQERMENLVGCMAAGDAVNGKRVLLVDDVVTSGATVLEAARALRRAGARSICVFAAARACGDMGEQRDPFAPFSGRTNRELR